MNLNSVKEIEINSVVVSEQQCTDGIGGFKIRGSQDSFYRISKSEVIDVQQFALGFLHGALFARGLQLNEVVFFPADTVDYANTVAKPVYCFEYKGLDGNTYYELETHFTKKGE